MTLNQNIVELQIAVFNSFRLHCKALLKVRDTGRWGGFFSYSLARTVKATTGNQVLSACNVMK